MTTNAPVTSFTGRYEFLSNFYLAPVISPEDDMEYPSFGLGQEEALAKKFQVPVVVNDRLPRDHFRLVVVTEEVLMGGKL